MTPRIQIYARKRRKGGLRKLLLSLARLLAVSFLLYLVVTFLLVSSLRVASVSMAPLLEPGEAVLVSPFVYGARLPFGSSRLPGVRRPRRGDVVVVTAPYAADAGVAARLLDPLVRFCTLGRRTLLPAPAGGAVARLLIKRVIAVPGDTVRMEGYRAWVRPAGGTSFAPEQEFISGDYLVLTGSRRSWPALTPFAGNMAELHLAEDEYFVLGDNRPDSSDSRAWGAVKLERIIGKVLLRYLPPRRIKGL